MLKKLIIITIILFVLIFSNNSVHGLDFELKGNFSNSESAYQIKGFAQPFSQVVLTDFENNLIQNTTSNFLGEYNLVINTSKINQSLYKIYSIDLQNKTGLSDFKNIELSSKNLIVENINLSPTLDVSGDNIRGFTVPNSQVIIEVDNEKYEEVFADKNGLFQFSFAEKKEGNYKLSALSIYKGVIFPKSLEKTVFVKATDTQISQITIVNDPFAILSKISFLDKSLKDYAKNQSLGEIKYLENIVLCFGIAFYVVMFLLNVHHKQIDSFESLVIYLKYLVQKPFYYYTKEISAVTFDSMTSYSIPFVKIYFSPKRYPPLITDNNGLVKLPNLKEKFHINAFKKGYTFPSNNIDLEGQNVFGYYLKETLIKTPKDQPLMIAMDSQKQGNLLEYLKLNIHHLNNEFALVVIGLISLTLVFSGLFVSLNIFSKIFLVLTLVFLLTKTIELIRFSNHKIKIIESRNQKPVKNVLINIYNEERKLINSLFTNNKGEISLELPKGKYYLNLVSAEYLEISQKLNKQVEFEDDFVKLKNNYMLVKLTKRNLSNNLT